MCYNSCSQNTNNCPCAPTQNYCLSINSGCSYTQPAPAPMPSCCGIQPANSNCSYSQPVKPISCCAQQTNQSINNCSCQRPCSQPQPQPQPRPCPQPQPCYYWVCCLYQC